MKPAPFDLLRPPTLEAALGMLAEAGPGARVLSGGQSLGPMLNLRVVQPRVLVQVNHLPALAGAAAAPEAVVLGACVTHAAIAAGRTPDLGDGWLARVAGAIAYQAVRNRGTIGGSLCHADPSADWLTVLTALDAGVVLQSPAGVRCMALGDFVIGTYATALKPGEILTAVRVPRPPPGATWRYAKACRKPGEFAHAMAAMLIGGGVRRLAIGALGGPPLLLTGAAAGVDGAAAALSGLDAVDRQWQLTVLRRLLQEPAACAA